MMETILDIGLNDLSVLGLAKTPERERFAWDSYRRLVQMFGATVMGVDGALFEEVLSRIEHQHHVADEAHLDACDLIRTVETFKDIIKERTREDFPQDPHEQLRRAVLAVFGSWNAERARVYRRREHIPDDLGTAVNIQTMVFGNRGADSGSGVAFTRDPATGRPGVYGDYLANAQGEDVVSGTRDAVPLEELRRLDPASYEELCGHMRRLEEHYRDLCDIEFTIEQGRLWMLQTRVGKRTAQAAFGIAGQLVDEGRISLDEALARVSGEGLARLMFPRFDTSGAGEPVARGVAASPGAAVGAAVFTSAEAVRRAAAGERVVLVRPETTPDDLPGMVAAQAVLTSRGGKTSHAAVVARGMGKVCVCGAEALSVDVPREALHRQGTSPSRRARWCPSTARRARGVPGRGAAGGLRGDAVLRGGRAPGSRAPSRSCRDVHRLLERRTRCGAWRCGRTPTPRRTRRGRGGSARWASGCAAPSTCSSVSGAAMWRR